jgi:hypothetical protein
VRYLCALWYSYDKKSIQPGAVICDFCHGRKGLDAVIRVHEKTVSFYRSAE